MPAAIYTIAGGGNVVRTLFAASEVKRPHTLPATGIDVDSTREPPAVALLVNHSGLRGIQACCCCR